MSIKYSTIAEVTKWSYVYNSIDLHRIPEELKTTLHCILQHKSNAYTKVVETCKKSLSPTLSLIGDVRQEILDIIPEIDKALYEDELLYTSYYLADDATVIYVYVPEEIELTNCISINLELMGAATVINFIPSNLMNYPKKMYKILYNLISSMIGIHDQGRTEITFPSSRDNIRIYSKAVILLSLVDLDNNEEMKNLIFNFLSKQLSTIKLNDNEDPSKKIESIYKETQHYSVEELLDRAYLLAIL